MPGLNLSLPNIALEIDTSSVDEEINRMRELMDRTTFIRAMYGVMNRTAGHVRTILYQDIPKQYNVKRKKIAEAVQTPELTITDTNVGCVIPIVGMRFSIGHDFPATGGAKGWQGYGRKRGKAQKGKKLKRVKAYTIKAKILKSGVSALPAVAEEYGGYPPFRNTANKRHKLVMTRNTSKRLPVQIMMSVSVPQMPMNRSQDEVQADILKYLRERVDRRLQTYLRDGR